MYLKKQELLDNTETWDCVLGKGMNDQMLDLIKYSNIYCKMDCKVLMAGYEVLKSWMLEHTGLDVDNSYNISINGIYIYVKKRLLSKCISNQWCITTMYY